MSFARRYIFSTDHKVIGIQYYLLALLAVFIGVALSAIMRFHLTYPQSAVRWMGWLWPTGAPGGVMTPELYLAIMTMHGTLMVFFVLTTAPQGAFGNYMLPLQIGAREMAFPRLNMLSFWTTFLSLLLLLSAFFVAGGPPISGWTSYPPLSALGPIAGPGQGPGMTLWILSIAVFSVAAVMTSVNFIATTLDLRSRGLSLMKMPLTCWSWFVSSILSVLAFSVLLLAGALLLLDREAGTSFFLPAEMLVSDRVIQRGGGSPLLYQHLFWFFGHPEVYIAILPGMGVVSTVLSVFTGRPIFGYKAMVGAMVAIGVLGFLLWGHHMFTSGMSPYAGFAFSALTMTIGAPSAVKTLNWLATLWGSRPRLTTAMLFAIGFVSVFVTGGLSGLILGQPALDTYFHDTYFVVAHLHLIMGVAAIFGIFAATFYWFPRVTGRLMHEGLGRVHFYLTYLGVHAIFFPMHWVGMAGNPRRYPDFTEFEFLKNLALPHKFMTHSALFTAAVQLLFFANLVWSLKRGAPAGENPWQADTLEWNKE